MYFASHSAIAPFSLHEPKTAQEAATLIGAHPDAAFLAGGVDLVPQMRAGATVSDLVALQGVDGLNVVAADASGLTMGGGATFDQLLSDPAAAAHFPEFMQRVADIGNIRVRCAATVGGNLATRNAGYDLLPLLLAADASVRVVTPGGETPWPMPQGFVDWAPDGLIDRISIPAPDRAVLLLERRFKPVASVAMGLWHQAGRLMGRMAVGCAFDRIWTADLPEGAASLNDLAQDAADVAARMIVDLPTPADDPIASGSYRKRLIETVVRRQLESAGA